MAADDSTPPTKTCTKCNIAKPIEAFSFYHEKDKPKKRRGQCLACYNATTRARYALSPTKHKHESLEYYYRNKNKVLARKKIYVENNKAEVHAANKQWRDKNKTYIQIKQQQWHEDNKEYIKEYERKRRQDKKEELSQKKKAYVAAHREQVRERMRRWVKNNPDKIRAMHAKRRAHLHGAPRNDLTPQDWEDIQAAYKYRCIYCGQKAKLTQDHITPLSKGGSHTKANVVPACRPCNTRKKDRALTIPIQPLLL